MLQEGGTEMTTSDWVWMLLMGGVLLAVLQRTIVLLRARYILASAEAEVIRLRMKADDAARNLYEVRAQLMFTQFECPVCGLPRDVDDGIYEDSMGHQACDEADWS